VLDEVARYTPEERRLLEVRPGITDYASIRFRDEGAILKGQGDPHEAYVRLIRPEKMRLGLEYVRTQSFRTDLRIIGRTFAAVLGRGAAGGADRQS
jgi:lipopolysaccharide/colanic/teichoic acid biosynthesis glycosyltransferase